MNKEQIYDQQISPLMTQIIATCREHKISMVATFALPTEDDEGLFCTTHLPDETGKMPDRIQRMATVARQGTSSGNPLMLRTEHADGSQTIIAVMP